MAYEGFQTNKRDAACRRPERTSNYGGGLLYVVSGEA